jgi:hypothetical protein
MYSLWCRLLALRGLQLYNTSVPVRVSLGGLDHVYHTMTTVSRLVVFPRVLVFLESVIVRFVFLEPVVARSGF